MTFGLVTAPALDHPELVAPVVAAALRLLAADGTAVAVTSIDPALADTAAFCAAYDVPLAASANCVIVAGKRSDTLTHAACVVLATTRADVNGIVRRRLDARRASFAPMDEATSATQMEFGGITPIGLPTGWPVLVDQRVVEAGPVVIGSGIRGSKLVLPGDALALLPGAEVVPGLGREVEAG